MNGNFHYFYKKNGIRKNHYKNNKNYYVHYITDHNSHSLMNISMGGGGGLNEIHHFFFVAISTTISKLSNFSRKTS